MSVSGLIHIQKLCWLLGSQVPVLFDHSKLGPGFDLSRWQGFPQKKQMEKYTIGGFLQWGYPKLDGLWWKIPLKMDDLGVPPFRNPSIAIGFLCHALKPYFWSKNIKIGMVSVQESEQDGDQIRTLPGRSVKASSLRKHQDQYRKKLETLFKAADVTNDGFLELVSRHISYLGRAFLS